jgi:hypothetical protein
MSLETTWTVADGDVTADPGPRGGFAVLVFDAFVEPGLH